jgi:hypothetical protein
MFRRKSLKTFLFSGAALAAMAIAGPAAAQTDPAGDVPAAETEVAQADPAAVERDDRGDIVVTGTPTTSPTSSTSCPRSRDRPGRPTRGST